MMYVMSFCSAQISGRMAASTGSVETSIGDLDASTAGLSPFMGRIFPEDAFDGPVFTWNIQISRGPNNVAVL